MKQSLEIDVLNIKVLLAFFRPKKFFLYGPNEKGYTPDWMN